MERDNNSFGEVVTLNTPQTGLGRRVGAELRAYWEGLRRGRLVPNRADIDPRGIDRALEYAFILERVAPGMGRFRLAGMHLNDLMGMEVRGMPLTAFFAPTGRKAIAEVTEAVFKGPAVAEIELTAETGIGKPPMKAKLLILPLKSDLGDVNRALGCLIAEGGDIGRTPRRFEVVAAQVTPVVQGAPTPAETPRPVSLAALGFGDTLDPFLPKPRPVTAVAPAPVAKPAAKPAAKPVPAAAASGLTPPAAPQEPRLAAFTPEERRAMFRIVRADS